MRTSETQRLRQFSERVARDFLDKRIRHPVHLSGGNERALVRQFRGFRKSKDWLFTFYRNHHHLLLAGLSEQEVLNLLERSGTMSFVDRKRRVVSSAIVAGQIPIALGMAWALARRRSSARVWCFMGDMAYYTGLAQDSLRLARHLRLPIRFVVEDNAMCCSSPTRKLTSSRPARVIWLRYRRRYPHVGIGKWVRF